MDNDLDLEPTPEDLQRAGRSAEVILVLSHYSQGTMTCACCGIGGGIGELVFLTLDHVDGGGEEHRRLVGRDTVAWAVRNGFPSEPALQVLCHNCNWARHRLGGICPHQLA